MDLENRCRSWASCGNIDDKPAEWGIYEAKWKRRCVSTLRVNKAALWLGLISDEKFQRAETKTLKRVWASNLSLMLRRRCQTMFNVMVELAPDPKLKLHHKAPMTMEERLWISLMTSLHKPDWWSPDIVPIRNDRLALHLLTTIQDYS